MLDLKKTFDSMTHTMLLRKLNLYGIWGNAHKLSQVIQNKAVRAICLLNWREHVTPYFFRCNNLKIKDVA